MENAEKDDYVWSILLFKVSSIKIKSNNQSDPAEEITKQQMSWKYVHLFNILIYMVTYDFLNQFYFLNIQANTHWSSASFLHNALLTGTIIMNNKSAINHYWCHKLMILINNFSCNQSPIQILIYRLHWSCQGRKEGVKYKFKIQEHWKVWWFGAK